MSALSAHLRQAAETVAFARLIPGETTANRKPARKPPSSVKNGGPVRLHTVAEIPEATPALHDLAFLLPAPMRTRAWKWLRPVSADFALVVLDWLLLDALLFALRTAFPQRWIFRYMAGEPGFLFGLGFLQGNLITLIGYSGGLYTGLARLREQGRMLANAILWSTVVLAIVLALEGCPAVRIALLLAAGGLHGASLFSWRQMCSQRRPNPSPEHVHNVLIVGAGSAGRQIASSIGSSRGGTRHVCGFLDDDRPLGHGVLGHVCDLGLVARRGFIDEVFLAGGLDGRLGEQVLGEAHRLRLDVQTVPALFGCRPADAVIGHIGDLPMICLHAEPLPSATLACKRWFDVLVATLALFLLLPLLAVIAVLIKFDSPGPVLYRAKRAGRKGVPFPCFKFRTMVDNAEQLKGGLRQANQRCGPFFKIADDPRVTRLGRFLRRYSLDELPQLWNVLGGEMSLVGPRPHPLDDFAGYESEHLARLDMAPGMTGLWQVTARRDPSFQRGMELDREYIQRWSFGLDLQILCKTMFVVIRGGGQ